MWVEHGNSVFNWRASCLGFLWKARVKKKMSSSCSSLLIIHKPHFWVFALSGANEELQKWGSNNVGLKKPYIEAKMQVISFITFNLTYDYCSTYMYFVYSKYSVAIYELFWLTGFSCSVLVLSVNNVVPSHVILHMSALSKQAMLIVCENVMCTRESNAMSCDDAFENM